MKKKIEYIPVVEDEVIESIAQVCTVCFFVGLFSGIIYFNSLKK